MKQLRNKVQLIGHLGRDVEIKDFENGRKMARVSIATNESYKNGEGEKVEAVQWHNIVAWGKAAETMSKLWKKGTEVAVQGKLVHRSYEDKDGNTKYVTEVVVNDFLTFG